MTRLITWLSRTFGFLGSAGIVVITVGLAANVVLRTVTGQGIPGMIEAVDPLLVCAAFLGLAVTESKGQHVAMTFVAAKLPVRPRFVVTAIGVVLTMLLIFWMGLSGAGEAATSIGRDEVRPGIVDIPLWPARIAVVAGCVVLLLQLVLTLRDATRSARERVPVGVWVERDS